MFISVNNHLEQLGLSELQPLVHVLQVLGLLLQLLLGHQCDGFVQYISNVKKILGGNYVIMINISNSYHSLYKTLESQIFWHQQLACSFCFSSSQNLPSCVCTCQAGQHFFPPALQLSHLIVSHFQKLHQLLLQSLLLLVQIPFWKIEISSVTQ